MCSPIINRHDAGVPASFRLLFQLVLVHQNTLLNTVWRKPWRGHRPEKTVKNCRTASKSRGNECKAQNSKGKVTITLSFMLCTGCIVYYAKNARWYSSQQFCESDFFKRRMHRFTKLMKRCTRQLYRSPAAHLTPPSPRQTCPRTRR